MCVLVKLPFYISFINQMIKLFPIWHKICWYYDIA